MYKFLTPGEIDMTTTVIDSKDPNYKKMREARENLLSKLADFDDEIIEGYTEKGADMDSNIIHSAIRRLTVSMQIIPVLCGSALKKKGMQPLLNAITRYLPSPLDRPVVFAEEMIKGTSKVLPGNKIKIESVNDDFFTALAFKVIHDQKRGIITYIRVYRGSLKLGTKIYNVNRDATETVLSLMRITGEKMKPVSSVEVGDICAIVGLKSVYTGDTIIDQKLSK